jgi:hypothetical protein
MRPRSLVKGLLTFFPGSQHFLPRRGTGGTNSAQYCYGVWLKHLTMLHEHGVTVIPETVAELGPGDSLGVGLAAMLSGSNRYFALDAVRHANVEGNLTILDELVDLFGSRAPAPEGGFPDFQQYLGEDRFPHHILTDARLAESLQRVPLIRSALSGNGTDSVSIEYHAPWSDQSVIRPGSVDLVLSHSVLEHVVDLPGTYRALRSWLKPGGVMSHQIDFTSHGLTRAWNGYRTEPEIIWRAAMGRRGYLINREPYSVHRRLIKENGFRIICELPFSRSDGISRKRLARRWRHISDDDLNCSGAFVQAVKPYQ